LNIAGLLLAAGAATLSIALVSLLLALTEGDRWGWASARILGAFGLRLSVAQRGSRKPAAGRKAAA